MPPISLTFFTKSQLAGNEGNPCYSLAQKRDINLVVNKNDNDFTSV